MLLVLKKHYGIFKYSRKTLYNQESELIFDVSSFNSVTLTHFAVNKQGAEPAERRPLSGTLRRRLIKTDRYLVVFWESLSSRTVTH